MTAVLGGKEEAMGREEGEGGGDEAGNVGGTKEGGREEGVREERKNMKGIKEE